MATLTTTRRALHAGLAALAMLPALAPASAAVTARQGSFEVTLEPIVDPRAVDVFYGYSTVNASSAATGLETAQTSLLFFYQQDAGPKSLVVLHGIYNDVGGSAVLAFSGLPPGTVYGVQDDPFDTYSNDPPVNGQTTATSTWSTCCTDGLALTEPVGSGGSCLAVTPTFASGVSSWQLLSGPSLAVTRTPLPNLTDTVYFCDGCLGLLCPPRIEVNCAPGNQAYVDVHAAGLSVCGGAQISNDFTGGGSDASAWYPVGATTVTFRLVDAIGFSGTCTTVVDVDNSADPVPPDQGNVLMAVKSDPDVWLDFTGAPATAWRIYRDADKLALGTTPDGADVAVPQFVDPGILHALPDLAFYRIKGLSPCTQTPGP